MKTIQQAASQPSGSLFTFRKSENFREFEREVPGSRGKRRICSVEMAKFVSTEQIRP